MKRPKGRSRKATFAFAPAIPPPAQTPPVDLEISRDPYSSLAEAEIRPIPPMPIALFSHNPSAEAEIRALRTISNVAVGAGDLLAISSTLDHNFTVIIGDGTQLSRAAYLEAFTSIFKQSVPVCYQRIPTPSTSPSRNPSPQSTATGPAHSLTEASPARALTWPCGAGPTPAGSSVPNFLSPSPDRNPSHTSSASM